MGKQKKQTKSTETGSDAAQQRSEAASKKMESADSSTSAGTPENVGEPSTNIMAMTAQPDIAREKPTNPILLVLFSRIRNYRNKCKSARSLHERSTEGQKLNKNEEAVVAKLPSLEQGLNELTMVYSLIEPLVSSTLASQEQSARQMQARIAEFKEAQAQIVALEAKISGMLTDIDVKNNYCDELRQTLTATVVDLRKTRDELDRQKAHIQSLEATIEDKDADIEKRDEEIDALKKQIKQKEKEMQDRNADHEQRISHAEQQNQQTANRLKSDIEVLNQRIQLLESQLDAQEQSLKEKDTQLQTKDTQLAEFDQQVSQLQEQIETQQQVISNLENTIETMNMPGAAPMGFSGYYEDPFNPYGMPPHRPPHHAMSPYGARQPSRQPPKQQQQQQQQPARDSKYMMPQQLTHQIQFQSGSPTTSPAAAHSATAPLSDTSLLEEAMRMVHVLDFFDLARGPEALECRHVFLSDQMMAQEQGKQPLLASVADFEPIDIFTRAIKGSPMNIEAREDILAHAVALTQKYLAKSSDEFFGNATFSDISGMIDELAGSHVFLFGKPAYPLAGPMQPFMPPHMHPAGLPYPPMMGPFSMPPHMHSLMPPSMMYQHQRASPRAHSTADSDKQKQQQQQQQKQQEPDRTVDQPQERVTQQQQQQKQQQQQQDADSTALFEKYGSSAYGQQYQTHPKPYQPQQQPYQPPMKRSSTYAQQPQQQQQQQRQTADTSDDDPTINIAVNIPESISSIIASPTTDTKSPFASAAAKSATTGPKPTPTVTQTASAKDSQNAFARKQPYQQPQQHQQRQQATVQSKPAASSSTATVPSKQQEISRSGGKQMWGDMTSDDEELILTAKAGSERQQRQQQQQPQTQSLDSFNSWRMQQASASAPAPASTEPKGQQQSNPLYYRSNNRYPAMSQSFSTIQQQQQQQQQQFRHQRESSDTTETTTTQQHHHQKSHPQRQQQQQPQRQQGRHTQYHSSSPKHHNYPSAANGTGNSTASASSPVERKDSDVMLSPMDPQTLKAHAEETKYQLYAEHRNSGHVRTRGGRGRGGKQQRYNTSTTQQ